LGHKTREILALGCSLRSGVASAVLAVSVLAAPAYAQDSSRVERTSAPTQVAQIPAPILTPNSAPAHNALAPTSSQSSGQGAGDSSKASSGPTSTFIDSLIPGFTLHLGVDASESLTTNSGGSSANSNTDAITLLGVRADIHDHSRRVSFDANYNGGVDFYANGTQHTQFANYLDALANVIVIPDYVNFIGRAFAQPVVTSSVGIVTADGSVASNGYSNSYGYSVGPDITFRLGDFATSETNATYGAAYFTAPAGSVAFPLIPGVLGPQDTTQRSFTERLASGTDFSRLGWALVAADNETDRPQGLLTEKSGIGQLRYAITRGFALLGTGGYDKISNTIPLRKNISGPVATGGFSWTPDEDLSLQVEVGQKYNSPSYQGLLRWNITPSLLISGSATDSIDTPEGQLLNNLSSLSATLDGTLAAASNVYGNGRASSLASFSTMSAGANSFNQGISRYQRVDFTIAQDFDRNHFNVNLYGSRQTQLDVIFAGQLVNNSYGGLASYSRDISRATTASIGFGYQNYEELGGSSGLFSVDAQVTYSLGPSTQVYFRGDYLTRDASHSLQTLSPFTGNLDDIRLMIGISHQLL
jgi:uncharacterized protein (PEP-CTERM system associated)